VWVGRVLTLIAFVFIIVSIARYDADFSISLAASFGLILASIVCSVAVVVSAFIFSWMVRMLSGIRIDQTKAILIFCSSNLYKYLPGNIMHLLGRNRLAIETEGLSHGKVAMASALDSLFHILAAVLIAAVSVSGYFLIYISQFDIRYELLLASLVCVFAAVCATLFISRQRAKKWIKQLWATLGEFKIYAMAKLLIACILRLVLLAFMYLIVLVLLGQSIAGEDITRIIGLFALSWVIGFIVPGAPGGLGIREAMLLLFIGGTFDEGILLSSVVFYRIVCVGGDVIAYVYAFLYSKYKNYFGVEHV